MSLTSALTCPRTPLRRFLDRELSAGTEPIRESFRAQHTTDRLLHLPDGVGTEAGTVGTAIDHRLRPPFTATPVAGPAADGVRIAGTMGGPFAAERMAAVGREPLDELTATARTL